jgi:ribonuclease P protein component
MLAAAQRIRRSTDFADTIRTGRRTGRGALVVHLTVPQTSAPESADAAGEPAPPVRAGFVVSKAVGNAVHRNRVRRRLRHLVRDRLAGLPAGTDVVVRALRGAAELSYGQLGADLDGALAAAQRGRQR